MNVLRTVLPEPNVRESVDLTSQSAAATPGPPTEGEAQQKAHSPAETAPTVASSQSTAIHQESTVEETVNAAEPEGRTRAYSSSALPSGSHPPSPAPLSQPKVSRPAEHPAAVDTTLVVEDLAVQEAAEQDRGSGRSAAIETASEAEPKPIPTVQIPRKSSQHAIAFRQIPSSDVGREGDESRRAERFATEANAAPPGTQEVGNRFERAGRAGDTRAGDAHRQTVEPGVENFTLSIGSISVTVEEPAAAAPKPAAPLAPRLVTVAGDHSSRLSRHYLTF